MNPEPNILFPCKPSFSSLPYVSAFASMRCPRIILSPNHFVCCDFRISLLGKACQSHLKPGKASRLHRRKTFPLNLAQQASLRTLSETLSETLSKLFRTFGVSKMELRIR
jgi:hypothetical protein